MTELLAFFRAAPDMVVSCDRFVLLGNCSKVETRMMALLITAITVSLAVGFLLGVHFRRHVSKTTIGQIATWQPPSEDIVSVSSKGAHLEYRYQLGKKSVTLVKRIEPADMDWIVKAWQRKRPKETP